MNLKDRVTKLENLLNEKNEFVTDRCVDFSNEKWSLTIYKERIEINTDEMYELELTPKIINNIIMIQKLLKKGVWDE